MSGRRSWLWVALLAAVLYFVVSTVSARLADPAVSMQAVKFWRFVAFGVCGVIFVVHVGFERWRLRSSVMATAMHAAVGAAVGGFLLAVGANAHAWQTRSGNQGRLLFALVAWPVVTGVPAFVLAWVGTAMLSHRRRG